MRSSRSTPAVLGLVVLVIYGCDPDKGDFDDEDDLQATVVSCEEAIAHLEECCPAFDPRRQGQCVDHAYQQTSGCDSVTKKSGHTLPEMTLDESRCVRRTECADLVARGICDRVEANGPRGNWSWSYDFNVDHVHESKSGTFEHEAVCP